MRAAGACQGEIDMKTTCKRGFPVLVAVVLAAALGSAAAADTTKADATDGAREPYSPYARSYPTRPFFGDTHLHTSYSMDAGAFGARLTPRDAYVFAKGNEITSSTGQKVRLSRPLDFMVVTDHSDGFGFFPLIFAGTPEIMADPQGKKWHDLIASGRGAEAAADIIVSFGKGAISNAIMPVPGTPAYRGAWDETIKAAEEANDPGHFTAFIGYEWTSNTGGNNLHRNVIFRDNGDKAGQIEPYTTQRPLGSDNPRDLWKWLDAYEKKTGGRVMAIAHNGNLSNGRMFPIIDSFSGQKIDREYAETRARWEHLYEVTQIKGDGETTPFLSPNDEFANFERWIKGNLDLSVAKTNDMLQYEYARSALRNGLKLERELGVNPYKFGLVGSTDSHTGLTTADEDNFFGKASNAEPSPGRALHPFVPKNPMTGLEISGWETSASGYVGVWAMENTRTSLFDAMERRETYATTGPRMVVRFFGGWNFEPADARTREPADAGYAKGVPMGGDLRHAPANKAPTFLVAAMKDPLGANLDRIQIVKGWLDAKGETHEQVYDVVWGDADRRKRGPDGKVPPVGNTVDVANATWTDTIGDPELVAVWKDPKFDPQQSAFYYARVLQIPTPRWTAYDAKYYHLTMPKEIPMVLQDRAYTSPIWYTP
jgi:hypothetical protein